MTGAHTIDCTGESIAGIRAVGSEQLVSTASRPGDDYETDGVFCECEAVILAADPACLHRAVWW